MKAVHIFLFIAKVEQVGSAINPGYFIFGVQVLYVWKLEATLSDEVYLQCFLHFQNV